MASDYTGLTSEELTKALKRKDQEVARLKHNVETERHGAKIVQGAHELTAKHWNDLNTELLEVQRRSNQDRQIAAINRRVCAALARAWLDMIDHLRE